MRINNRGLRTFTKLSVERPGDSKPPGSFYLWRLGSLLLPMMIFSATAQVVEPKADVLAESLDFFASEHDADAVDKIFATIVEKRPGDLSLIAKYLEIVLQKKDRSTLFAVFAAILEHNNCPLPVGTLSVAPVCQELARLWQGNLENVFFFEDTVGKLEKARRLAASKNCAESLGVLKEVQSREGAFKLLLEMILDNYICLQDMGSAEVTRNRLKEVRMLRFEK